MTPANEVVEIKTRYVIHSVLFTEDGEHVLGGGGEGALRRWRVDDGHEIGEPIRMANAHVYAVALSPNGKWLVCGLYVHVPTGAGATKVMVWDVQTQEKVLDLRGHPGTNYVASVDISPDSTRFATGSGDAQVFVWRLPSGEKLLGPLVHSNPVVATRFSPNGDRIATATCQCSNQSIRIFASDNGRQLLDIPFNFYSGVSTPLAWSTDGRRLFAVSSGETKCFDASTGSLVTQWSVPPSSIASIVLSSSERFAAVAADKSLSFWDLSTGRQIGNTIEQAGSIYGITLSSDNSHVATGSVDGKVTLRNLHSILPDSYLAPLPLQLPFISIDHTIFDLWKQGDLTRAEECLTEQIVDPSCSAHTFAQRALVRRHLGQLDMALADAEKSIEVERSVFTYIANAVIRASGGRGEHGSAFAMFDRVFSGSLSAENNQILLLIKAIIFFECGERDDAISRVDYLITVVEDKSLYLTVKAKMHLLIGGISLDKGDVEQAITLFRRARDAMPLYSGSPIILISLIFGWDFDKFEDAIEQNLQRCIKPIEDLGDAAVTTKTPEEAIRHYSIALSLNPPNPAGVLVKRSKAYASVKSWNEALTDADAAIKADPESPWGYETRYVALCGQGLIDDAFDAFTRMFSFVEGSTDEDICQLAKKYVSPSRSVSRIDEAIREVSKTSPLVLIDVKSGRLCDDPRRRATFKSEPEFRELMSSMVLRLDHDLIQRVVVKYFEYVTLSHVWEGMEPLLQDVDAAGTVWELYSVSSLNAKLQNFCKVVRADGYRWAWSDTCCIDKTIGTVLNQSLKMMYLWYELSAATFIFLTDVELLSTLLKDCKWLTRAWTSQELLSPRVIRFYTRDWKPYRGDTNRNHKDSPEIMQELSEAIGIARKNIVSFHPDDLTVRQKLRLASTRNATREEDVAYSLIGIFKSDIRPDYGEGYAALGHLLEEIVARSGEVTVLDWTGRPSPYNSCLPSSLAVYSRPPVPPPALSDLEIVGQVSELKEWVSRSDALWLYDQITALPPARFSNRRLFLSCVIFAVRKLGVQKYGNGFRYRARAWGIGDVDFYTSDKLSQMEPRKLIFVHPWIRNLCDPPSGFSFGRTEDDDDDDDDFSFGPDADESAPSSPLQHVPPAPVDEYTRALRLVARLQQPFHALLLQQQSSGEFKRVAAEHEIVIPGIRRGTNLSKDVCTAVLEIL